MKEFRPDIAAIPFDKTEVYHAMGYPGTPSDRDITESVDRMSEEAFRVCKPAFGYLTLPLEKSSGRSVNIGDVEIMTGPVITPLLSDAEFIAVFVATAGREFDEWLGGVKSRGTILDQFIADAIGSELAEATARAMAERLSAEMAASGMSIGNSYSPGYCGWHVGEQQNLFRLLPPEPCGISLSASSLMSPIKSVSGVIAVGRDVRKMAYGCEICEKNDCYKKNGRGHNLG